MEKGTFSSFGDDSDEARAASEQYEPALKMCLEREDWSFARQLVSLKEILASEIDVIDADLPFGYLTPADMVKLQFVEVGVKWRLDSELIRADKSGGLTIRYTKLVTNETKLPALFQDAVSHQLAVKLAPDLVTSRTKRNELKADLSAALRDALKNDLQSASLARIDGLPDQPDWAGAATA